MATTKGRGLPSANSDFADATLSGRIGYVSMQHVPRELNVLGEPLVPCGTEPLTGFYRDGSCSCGPEQAVHLICVVATAEFLEHQRRVGNDLSTPAPTYGFPGLRPGDRWCVVAQRWAQAEADGAAAPVVLAATNLRATELVPFDVLQRYAVDVPDDLSSLA
jgi:uncharacterized protein